ncbi:hypothetical protein OUZ56_023077 [Daphnia magna]|uniref:Uncharacterized protein n=1 Tax=Daphnia magna TaxID=35525 RepID=A0ABR0AYD3_9CRUS|nr:hypothetical protein OUZ56_023077 [Daphnia magna]
MSRCGGWLWYKGLKLGNRQTCDDAKTIKERILQARLELATSALLSFTSIFHQHIKLLSYKYHALTNCATGDIRKFSSCCQNNQ